ncbi:MAG: TorF family putative porin [Gammaproteobacteria bacterium]|nr:TorF family putative porin [Gammaproteobacteria bacterium]
MDNLKLALLGSGLMLASSGVYAVEISGNVALASDYVYRGISQTNEEATIQGGFDVEGESGLYVGVWASNIAFDGSIEVDVYAGYGGEFSEDLGFDIGILRYEYPDDVNSSFSELYGSLSYKELTVGVAYSSDFFLESDTSTYVFVDYSFSLPNEFGLDLHYAEQSIDDNDIFGTPDYAEYSLSLTRTVADIDLSLTWYDTDLSNDDCFLDSTTGIGTNLCESRVVFGLSKSL